MILLYLILILFSLVALLMSFFFIFKPEFVIELQRRFYAQINWKIEPISMQKELRNTRIMGFMLIILVLTTLLFIF